MFIYMDVPFPITLIIAENLDADCAMDTGEESMEETVATLSDPASDDGGGDAQLLLPTQSTGRTG